jgi:hypothetical protein
MKGGGSFLLVLLVAVISVLGYYNFEQQNTIELLNEEILKQARLRHNLILEKRVLEQKIENITADSLVITNESE